MDNISRQMQIPVRNTIFLQGVFFSQVRTLEEKMIEENIAQQCHEEMETETPMHKFSDLRITRFRSKKQWAEAYKDTTLKCWYCGLSFKGLPCFIPRQIRNTTHGKEYDTQGLFCGFSCAYTFLKTQAEYVRNKSFMDKMTMLKMLFVMFYNKRILEFKEAPTPYDMTLYGGHIDIVEYRNSLRRINQEMISKATYICKRN